MASVLWLYECNFSEPLHFNMDHVFIHAFKHPPPRPVVLHHHDNDGIFLGWMSEEPKEYMSRIYSPNNVTQGVKVISAVPAILLKQIGQQECRKCWMISLVTMTKASIQNEQEKAIVNHSCIYKGNHMIV